MTRPHQQLMLRCRAICLLFELFDRVMLLFESPTAQTKKRIVCFENVCSDLLQLIPMCVLRSVQEVGKCVQALHIHAGKHVRLCSCCISLVKLIFDPFKTSSTVYKASCRLRGLDKPPLHKPNVCCQHACICAGICADAATQPCMCITATPSCNYSQLRVDSLLLPGQSPRQHSTVSNPC